MVTSRVRGHHFGPSWLLTALLGLGTSAGYSAAGTPPATGAAGIDSLFTPDLPVDLEEVVQEIDSADQPLPQRELAAATGREGGDAAAPPSNRLYWRLAAAAAAVSQDGRLQVATGPLTARLAVRLRRGNAAAVAGGAGLRAGNVVLWGGHLALRHGFGLVATDPARRGSLTADQSFGQAAGGLVIRTAQPATGAAGGVQWEPGPWRLAILGENLRPAAATPDTAAPVPGLPARWSLRLGRDGEAGQWAVLARRDTAGTAVSGTGQVIRGGLAVGWELAAWRPVVRPVASAGLAMVRWQPVPGLRAELLTGFSTGTEAARAAVLAGGPGTGWAVRLAWRERNHGAIEALFQGSRGDAGGVRPRRRAQSVSEVAWERRATAAATVFVRWRRSSRVDSEWSETEPWLPAAAVPAAVRTLVTVGVERGLRGATLTTQWRSFTVTGSATSGTRQMVAITARRQSPDRWQLWLDAAAAWGDPVDLVRGLGPLPGLVVPRHWGAWQSELLAGAARSWSRFEIRAALARRLPTASGAGAAGRPPAALSGWVDVRRAF